MTKYEPYIRDKRFVSGQEMFSYTRNRETVSSLLYKYKNKEYHYPDTEKRLSAYQAGRRVCG